MTKILDGEMYIRLKPKMLLQNILRTIDTYFCSSFQDDNSQIYDNNQPQLQRQTEAELSLDEIREREAAIRQLEVGLSLNGPQILDNCTKGLITVQVLLSM